MKKLRLQPDELRVESFDTSAAGMDGAGTVRGLLATAIDDPCSDTCRPRLCSAAYTCDTCNEACFTAGAISECGLCITGPATACGDSCVVCDA
ncbi:MAG TPA: hypothetical protein VFH27_13735 [Longimicrobiaceae bacterium]|nr:hypothetical protein [Longimicrobiaceae bacterium]